MVRFGFRHLPAFGLTPCSQLKLQIFLPLLPRNKHCPCLSEPSCPRQKFKNRPVNLFSLFPHPLVTKSCLSKLILLPFPQPLLSQVPHSCPSRGLLATKLDAAARVIISIPCRNPFHNFQSVSEKVKTPKSLGPFLMPPSPPSQPSAFPRFSQTGSVQGCECAMHSLICRHTHMLLPLPGTLFLPICLAEIYSSPLDLHSNATSSRKLPGIPLGCGSCPLGTCATVLPLYSVLHYDGLFIHLPSH